MTTQIQKLKVPARYNGNQLTQTDQNEQNNFALNIDFLIINLELEPNQEGQIKKFDVNSIFDFEAQDFGTNVFKNRYFVILEGVKVGTLLTSPRSNILKENFAQFQFENSLFYTQSLKDLRFLTEQLTENLKAKFVSINRLDIALDLENTNNNYQEITKAILNEELLISGREKQLNAYFITDKGTPKLNGFTIGTRTASRFLRVYNKTLELTKKPKEYILNTWLIAGLNPQNVWRFEYQMNNSFFRFLEQKANFSGITENFTFNIFDERTLFLILERAQKNHFEIKLNTGLSQTNKEPDFILINFALLKTKINGINKTIVKLKKGAENSLLSIKRQIKSAFREYYNSSQNNISSVLYFNQLFEDYDNTLTRLHSWFNEKKPFYLEEFQKKQRKTINFDNSLFREHLSYSI
jgi:hypothetical protein